MVAATAAGASVDLTHFFARVPEPHGDFADAGLFHFEQLYDEGFAFQGFGFGWVAECRWERGRDRTYGADAFWPRVAGQLLVLRNPFLGVASEVGAEGGGVEAANRRDDEVLGANGKPAPARGNGHQMTEDRKAVERQLRRRWGQGGFVGARPP